MLKSLLQILEDWYICPITGEDKDFCNDRKPDCNHRLSKHHLRENPKVTVDIVIRHLPTNRIIMISRKNEPLGWALPGGFVDVGETTMQAAIREAYEETQVKISNVKQFHTYSDPSRDPRGHNITIVYTADTIDNPIAADDAKSIGWFDLETHMVYTLKNGYLYDSLCFDHAQILMDVIRYQKTGEKPNRE